MGYMKKNVNIMLLLLIAVIAVSLVGLTRFYHSTFFNLTSEYNRKVVELKETASNLQASQTQLNQTAIELELKTEREKDLSERYTEERTEKRKVQDELNKTREELRLTRQELAGTQAELTLANETLQAKIEELAEATSKIGQFRDGVNDIISALSSWTSTFNSYFTSQTTSQECKAILGELDNDVDSAKGQAQDLDEI